MSFRFCSLPVYSQHFTPTRSPVQIAEAIAGAGPIRTGTLSSGSQGDMASIQDPRMAEAFSKAIEGQHQATARCHSHIRHVRSEM